MIHRDQILNREVTPTDVLVQVQEGMRWKRVSTGYAVVEVHYTADERKRSKEWYAEARRGLPLMSFNREYELMWIVHDGTPVYLDWSTELHIAKNPIVPVRGAPIIRGWDLGPTARWKACVVGQAWSGTYLRVFKDYLDESPGVEEFVDYVLTDLNNTLGPEFEYFDFVDPAGFVATQTDAQAATDILRQKGTSPQPGPVGYQPRLKSVNDLLIAQRKGVPCYQVCPEGCRTLIDGFNGGYHLRVFEGLDRNKELPEKNEFSHTHDANQYLCHGFKIAGTPTAYSDEQLPDTWQVLDSNGMMALPAGRRDRHAIR